MMAGGDPLIRHVDAAYVNFHSRLSYYVINDIILTLWLLSHCLNLCHAAALPNS